MRVQFLYNERRPVLPGKALLKSMISDQFRIHKKKLEHISFIFCTDQYLLEINRQFLKHDYYTDIITFNLSEDPEIISAEVYISVDRVKENAISHGVTLTDELLRVIFHGTLHLVGFGDKSNKEKTIMRAKEDELIDIFRHDHNQKIWTKKPRK